MVSVEFGTVLGALLSGAVGGAASVEYRYRREQYHELRKWYSRTERLAERVLRVNYSGDEWTDAQVEYARATCAGVHSELASHMGEAPPSVDDAHLDICEELVGGCQSVKMLGREEFVEDKELAVRTRTSSAADAAKNVSNMASQKREQVGPLRL